MIWRARGDSILVRCEYLLWTPFCTHQANVQCGRRDWPSIGCASRNSFALAGFRTRGGCTDSSMRKRVDLARCPRTRRRSCRPGREITASSACCPCVSFSYATCHSFLSLRSQIRRCVRRAEVVVVRTARRADSANPPGWTPPLPGWTPPSRSVQWFSFVNL